MRRADDALRAAGHGHDFDFFDARANTDSPQVTPPQRDNRQRLRAAMERAGLPQLPDGMVALTR